jgi:hypothetical protein
VLGRSVKLHLYNQKKPVDNINARNDRIVITNGTYSWLFASRFPIYRGSCVVLGRSVKLHLYNQKTYTEVAV